MRAQGFAAGMIWLATMAGSSWAQEPRILARAEAVQPPVWLERGGQTRALPAGAPLQAGDRYLTGAGGRLHLSFDEGSVVKLGERAQFELPALQLKAAPEDSNGVMQAAFKVLRGAFRFTTSALGALRRREVEVFIGSSVTAGIRGTDIWGSSDTARDLLCLLEGRVKVSSPGQAAQILERPSTSYIVPRGQSPLPLVPEPREQIERYIPQTELLAGTSVLLAEGEYQIALDSFASLKEAQARQVQLGTAGHAARIVAAQIKGKTWQRLVVDGLASKAAAQAHAARMSQEFGFASPWVLPLAP